MPSVQGEGKGPVGSVWLRLSNMPLTTAWGGGGDREAWVSLATQGSSHQGSVTVTTLQTEGRLLCSLWQRKTELPFDCGPLLHLRTGFWVPMGITLLGFLGPLTQPERYKIVLWAPAAFGRWACRSG